MMAAALIGGAMVTQTPEASIDVVALRFYRGRNTLVDGFVKVPYSVLEPLGTGPDAKARYRVDLVVRDSAGTLLNSSGWVDSVSHALLQVSGVSTVQHFAFTVPAGRYTVDVTLHDSASGQVRRQHTEVSSYGGRPRASDLLLSNAIRKVGSDTAPAAGEIRKGSVFIVGATKPVLTPRQSTLYYYVELYPGADAVVPVVARVMGQDGKQIIAAPAAPQHVGAGGGVVTSGLDLTGLPPGEYRLALDMKFADSAVTRSAAFQMAGFATEQAVAEVSRPAGAGDKYAGLSEAELDTLYAPLVHIMDASERGVYEGLSVEGKRNYLRAFWAKRDPTPGTPANESEVDYYRRIAEANRLYREGGAAGIPGWRTDRGRIFIRYGPPDETLKRPQAGSTPPYEVWKYTSGKARKFVFLDQTRFGNYSLIYTDEVREPSRSDWMELLGPEAVQDVQRF